MPPTYHELRASHFRILLKRWFQGLDKSLLAIAGVLPIGITAVIAVFVLLQIEALRVLLRADATFFERAPVVAAWQFLAFVILRALRPAALMPGSRAFFAALPVSAGQEFRSDLWLAIQSYSLLWIPFAWVIGTSQPEPALITICELVAVSLCVNLAGLRGRSWHSSIAIAALLVLALPGDAGAAGIAKAAAATIAAFSLWRSYLPPRARAASAARPGALAHRAALGSGLALPFLANELRSNVLIRLGAIATVLAACLVLTALRGVDAPGTRTLVFVAATAAVSLYALPALCRTVLLTKLHFLAGQQAFVRRMRLTVYGIPVLLFCTALVIGWSLDHGQTSIAAPLFFSLTFIGGAIAARGGVKSMSWFMPVINFVAVFVLGGMI